MPLLLFLSEQNAPLCQVYFEALEKDILSEGLKDFSRQQSQNSCKSSPDLSEPGVLWHPQILTALTQSGWTDYAHHIISSLILIIILMLY